MRACCGLIQLATEYHLLLLLHQMLDSVVSKLLCKYLLCSLVVNRAHRVITEFLNPSFCCLGGFDNI